MSIDMLMLAHGHVASDQAKIIITKGTMSPFSPADRWFCEGRELHNSPDIQIWRDGDLHTLVISEAFEDDTGRYNCVASNSLGADNTSAEVYIEGQPLSQQQRDILHK